MSSKKNPSNILTYIENNLIFALKCLHNSQKFIDSIINEAKKYSINHEALQTLDSNKEVALKCLHKSQESVDSLINKAKKYPTKHEAFEAFQVLDSNKEVALKCLHKSQESIVTLIDEAKKYSTNNEAFQVLDDLVFEWIPYDQFNEIKETVTNGLITIYLAIWKDGPLKKNWSDEDNWSDENYLRDSNREVSLKCLHNSQESINSIINEIKKYPTNHEAFQILYGISQNPVTGDYILVQNNYIWNKSIDWIINEAKKYPTNHKALHLTSRSDKEVSLRYLHNSQESIDYLINEAKKYPTNNKEFQVLYGISQNPDTGNYILVQDNSTNMLNWISGNDKIDDFIQERQLKINNYYNVVPEWIPYDQFNEIQVIGTNGFITVYSAIWKDGPLYKEINTWDIWSDGWNKNYARDSDKKVALICLHNSQDSIEFLLNKAKKYSIKHEALFVLYGISQNSDTNDYILIQNDPIVNIANWFNGNEKIDDFIQEIQSKIDNNGNNLILEWIPYNQFNEIKEIGKNGSITVYSAIWRDGPLHSNRDDSIEAIWKDSPLYYGDDEYEGDSDKEVALKYLHKSQESIDYLINEVKIYPTILKAFQALYIRDSGKEVALKYLHKSQESIDSLINEAKKYPTKYKAFQILDSNKKVVLKCLHNSQKSIDSLINKVKKYPENHKALQVLDSNKKVALKYLHNSQNFVDVLINKAEEYEYYSRDSNKKVVLKCLNKSQQSIDSIINKVRKYLTNMHDRENWDIYGISQDSNTNDYILVLKLVSGNEKIDGFIKEMQLNSKNDLLFKWIPYGQFSKIKEISKNNSITIYSAVWTDGGLLQFENYYSEDMEDLDEEVALKLFHSSQDPIDSLINEVKKYSAKTSKNSLVTVHSAVWRDGPLHYHHGGYTRDSNKEVALKYLHNSENSIDFLINKAKKYSTKYGASFVLYGISQNPNTNAIKNK
ncbi:kinase-like domain-containing protein [Rhizophagus irregularis DAOM 181602=DAOM 197198]|nr:kinase-like domain-containing protein [Rhizophagus irregularis DAOM 181602=DAOM 197198]